MTARLLLRALAPLEPAVVAGELVLAGPPPAPIRSLLPALQTGVRAILTGRPWYAIGPDGRGVGPLADGALDPARPVPWLARKLCAAATPAGTCAAAVGGGTCPTCSGSPPSGRPGHT